MKSATLMLEATDFTTTPERMDELSRLLNGFVFSNLAVPADGRTTPPVLWTDCWLPSSISATRG